MSDPSSIGDEAAKVAQAVSGPGTPNAVNLSRPTAAAMWCQVGALASACLAVAGFGACLMTLAFSKGATEAVILRVVFFLGWGLLASIACIALSALSQFFNRVSASAGPGHLDLGGR